MFVVEHKKVTAMANFVPSTKRKAADFFVKDNFEDESIEQAITKQLSRTISSSLEKPTKSRAQVLKDAIQKQFADATSKDNSLTKSSSEHWARSDVSNLSKSLVFDEKYSSKKPNNGTVPYELRTLIDDEQVSTIGVNYSRLQTNAADMHDMHDMNDRKHHDAIFSSSVGNNGTRKLNHNENHDYDKTASNYSGGGIGQSQRVMITSFSNQHQQVDSTETNDNEVCSAEVYVPQSKFGKLLMSKHSGSKPSDSSNSNTNSTADSNIKADIPLYKQIKSKDYVMARCPSGSSHSPYGDHCRHAQIKSVMHGGYMSAMYDIVFTGGDGKIETISWSDIQCITTAEAGVVPTHSHSLGSSAVAMPNNGLTNGGPAVLSVEELANIASLNANIKAAQSYAAVSNNPYSRAPSSGGGNHYGNFPPPPPPAGPVIKSIRYDSATGMATVNEDSSTSRTSLPITTATHTSSSSSNSGANVSGGTVAARPSRFASIESVVPVSAPVKDWTVNPNAVPLVALSTSFIPSSTMAVASSSVAPAAFTTSKPLINAQSTGTNLTTPAPVSAAPVVSVPVPSVLDDDVPVVNPKLLQQRSKGGWKTAKR